MYKTASQYLGPSQSNLMEPYKNVNPVRENFQYTHRKETFEQPAQAPSASPKPVPTPSPSPKPVPNPKPAPLNMTWDKKNYGNFSDPRVWGPAFWFSLHTSAMSYPVHASPLFKERMKGRILAIPYEIPCSACKPHASAFIENHKDKLDEIVSSRKNLFNFYVDFHNKVNERYQKKKYTYREAWELYSGTVNVNTLSYT